ncbi:MAG: hypothetical protein RR827_08600 [Oscillospiraceae bacterium]
MKENNRNYSANCLAYFFDFLIDLTVIWTAFIFPQVLALLISIPKYKELRYLGSNFEQLVYLAIIVLCYGWIKNNRQKKLKLKMSPINVVQMCLVYGISTIGVIAVGILLEDISSRIFTRILFAIFPEIYVSNLSNLVITHGWEISRGLFLNSYSQTVALVSVNLLTLALLLCKWYDLYKCSASKA